MLLEALKATAQFHCLWTQLPEANSGDSAIVFILMGSPPPSELTWFAWPSLHALRLQMLLWWILDEGRGGGSGCIGEGLVERSGTGGWASDVTVGVAITHKTWRRGIRIVLKCRGVLGIGSSVVHIR